MSGAFLLGFCFLWTLKVPDVCSVPPPALLRPAIPLLPQPCHPGFLTTTGPEEGLPVFRNPWKNSQVSELPGDKVATQLLQSWETEGRGPAHPPGPGAMGRGPGQLHLSIGSLPQCVLSISLGPLSIQQKLIQIDDHTLF